MKAFGMSDKGCHRPTNQDRYLIVQGQGYTAVVVCDGMGGARAGELAAELAIDSFAFYLDRCMGETETVEAGVALREAAAYANIRVFDKARESDEYEGMGCTLVSALVRDNQVTLVNIGDSRAYLFSARGLKRITVDHSLVEELVRAGTITRAEASTHPQKNIITQAVGLEYRLHGDIYYPQVSHGDTLLLCSDGLSNVLERSLMEEILNKHQNLEEAAEEMMRKALERGAPDNVTVLLLRI